MKENNPSLLAWRWKKTNKNKTPRKTGEVTFCQVVLWPGERAQICKPSSALPFCHLSLSWQTDKKGQIFALGNQKKKQQQCIAMVLEITISGKEHFSEPEENPRRCWATAHGPTSRLRLYFEASAWADQASLMRVLRSALDCRSAHFRADQRKKII